MTPACDSQTTVFTRIQEHTCLNILLKGLSLAWTTIGWCCLGYFSLDVQIPFKRIIFHFKHAYIEIHPRTKKVLQSIVTEISAAAKKNAAQRKTQFRKRRHGNLHNCNECLHRFCGEIKIKTSYSSGRKIIKMFPFSSTTWLNKSTQIRVATGNSQFSDPLGSTGAVSKGKTVWTHLDAGVRWQNRTKHDKTWQNHSFHQNRPNNPSKIAA